MFTKTDYEYHYPMEDIMFKFLFGYQENIIFTEYLLELLLNLPSGALHQKLEITNSLTLEKMKYDVHGYELDVYVTLKDTIYNLEAYTSFGLGTKIKSLSYEGHLFSSQLKSGMKYYEVKPYVQINLIQGTEPSHDYVLTAKDNPNAKFLDKYFEIKIINIDEISKSKYNKDKKLKRLFAYLGEKDEEKAKEIIKGDDILEKMHEKSVEFLRGELAREIFTGERLMDAIHHDELEQTAISASNESKIEIAKNMLAENLNIELISKTTGLSIKEIEHLQN